MFKLFKRKSDSPASAPKFLEKLKRGAWKVVKVFLIITLSCMILGPITMGLAQLAYNVEHPVEYYTVHGLGDNNSILLSDSDGNVTEYDLMGCVLAEDADISEYIGKSVYLESDYKVSETSETGLSRCYIRLKDSDHILQIELIVDGIAKFGNMERAATHYQKFWESNVLGRYVG